MSKETFAFTSSTLRSLRLQREMMEWEDQRRAASRHYVSRRYQLTSRSPLSLPRSSCRIQYCRDPAVHNALYTGDLPRVQSIFKDETTANMIVETISEELVWSAELGMWVLTPQKKHTSPLSITAARGYRDCVKHLLLQGAQVDTVVGGRAALHESCASHRAECTRLLLTYGANPNILSEEGLAPLHLCTTQETLPCAQLLLEYGALVNQHTRDHRASPLHVAAKHGLDDHMKLYICYGANVAHRNREGETALNAACASADRPEDAGRYYRVVKRLLDAGADVRVAGRKNHTPLHNACSNCHAHLVELLLQHGAEVNVSNCAGYTPVDCALQAVEDYLAGEPERVIVTLLDHGAAPINPKMLKFCASSPRVMEVVLNSYGLIPSCDSWLGAVPPEVWRDNIENGPAGEVGFSIRLMSQGCHACNSAPGPSLALSSFYSLLLGENMVSLALAKSLCEPPSLRALLAQVVLWVLMQGGPEESASQEVSCQKHQWFYDSVLQLVNQPRPLQHLSRCAIRKQLGAQCHLGIAELKLPSSLKDYLHLPLEGYLK